MKGWLTIAVLLASSLSSSFGVTVYNANYGSGTITRWDTQDLNFNPSVFISGLNNPVGVAQDTTGNVYVTQFGNNGSIRKYDSAGSFLFSVTNLGYLPYSVRFDTNNTLYVADLQGSKIRRYDSSLQALSDWATTSGNPTSIQFTSQGFVLVANAGTGANAQKFSLDGTSQQIIGSNPTLSEPHDAVTDSSGNIYVASRATQTVVKYDSQGALVDSSFISGFDPYSLLFEDSTLFVAAHNLGTVRRYDASSGQYLGDFSVGTSPTYMTVDPNSVPEPSSGALLVAGITVFAVMRRRK